MSESEVSKWDGHVFSVIRCICYIDKLLGLYEDHGEKRENHGVR